MAAQRAEGSRRNNNVTVPVHIVSGFLGAGKTTVIRAQLEARRGERLAIIVNDFGEAGLDEQALGEGEPFRITNIPGGCVCCTAPEGFVGALGAVLDARPDRVIIEPTGLARPQDLIDTIRRSPRRDEVELAPVVVVVDPRELAPERMGALPLMREQAEAADVLVANHTDVCRPEDLERFERWAAGLWPEPLALHRTSHGRLETSVLDWPAGEGARAPRTRKEACCDAAQGGHEHRHEDSTAGFGARSWRWAPAVVFSRERLLDALARLANGAAGAKLARLKGIFRTQEGVYRLEVAGGDVHDRLTPYRRDSRVDVILQTEDPGPFERVDAWLAQAVLREDELELDLERIEVVLPDGRVHLVDRALLAALPDPVADISTLFANRSGSAARISRLWQSLGLPERGRAVVVAGDGFASEPVDVAALCQGFLLHSLGEAQLPAEQGGPFRLLIPEQAGAPLGACANVKGVAKLVLRGM
jgi:G3E family GTPase